MNKVLRRAFLAVVIALPVLVALTVGVAAVNRFAGPLPPRTFSMSTGREGGAYHQFALEYRRLLSGQGFTLVIEPRPRSAATGRRPPRGAGTAGVARGGAGARAPPADRRRAPPASGGRADARAAPPRLHQPLRLPHQRHAGRGHGRPGARRAGRGQGAPGHHGRARRA